MPGTGGGDGRVPRASAIVAFPIQEVTKPPPEQRHVFRADWTIRCIGKWRNRSTTRVSIGAAFHGWRPLLVSVGMKFDAERARFLHDG